MEPRICYTLRMRKQTAVLLILLVLSGLITVLHVRIPPVPNSSHTPEIPLYGEFPASQESPFSRSIVRSSDQIADLPSFSGRRESLSANLINRALPKLIANKEGSYTNLTDLLKTGEPRKLDINSDWMATRLFPNRTLPLMSMRVIRDPDTGEYRISGGALALPGTGLEAGYEAEFNSDERKATLQWKKSF
jgi:hypothetical protein